MSITQHPKDGLRGSGERRYSPTECIGCEKNPLYGNPNPANISTSFMERQNLTMRYSKFTATHWPYASFGTIG
jgi:hypothetical protein